MKCVVLMLSIVLIALATACAPPNLQALPADEQSALGEAAVAKVCEFELDVESTVTFEQEYNLALARQYLDEIVPQDLAEGQISQFFTLETIAVCAADFEWGGVNFDVQRLLERFGTEAEVRSLLTHSRSLERECRFSGGQESETFVSTCHALGFVE